MTPSPASSFSYDQAFARNLGWLTRDEQRKLQRTRVAIAGLGGVGGVYLTTLARLGIGAFTIADFDHFAIANFNRQAGATVSTLDRPKLEVMARMARDIQRLMRAAMTQLNLSARAYHRILKLARTIADLAGSDEIQSVHLAEALQYRPKMMLS